jgi:hypothetical protein
MADIEFRQAQLDGIEFGRSLYEVALRIDEPHRLFARWKFMRNAGWITVAPLLGFGSSAAYH